MARAMRARQAVQRLLERWERESMRIMREQNDAP
jgi:hypothetical protein